METKTHWKKLTNPDYIGTYILAPGEERTVKISHVKREQVAGINGKKEECTVAHLVGEKPFILNRTNAKTITKLYGSPYIEDWAGKLITIYAAKVSAFGEEVEALRIRNVKPRPAQPVDYSAQIASLRACATLESLQATYMSLTPEAKAATVNVKDEMKTKLMEAAQ
jgi:hypothetical protein